MKENMIKVANALAISFFMCVNALMVVLTVLLLLGIK